MPKLYEDLILSWEAFWTLCSSRSMTFGGMGSIPFSEIAAYLRFRRVLDLDLQDEIIEHVRILDTEYISEMLKDKEPKKEEPQRHDRDRVRRR